MVDHELLTLAARAAGITLTWPDGHDEYPRVKDADGRFWIWDPVDFDGDAFGLMVELSMRVEVWNQDYMHLAPYVDVAFDLSAGMDGEVTKRVGDDPRAATRLAITRAAAEIGKTMKE
jgi:hypothetical protein